MNTPLNSNQTPASVDFDSDHLKKVFLEHLNGIYQGKKHLLVFLQEIEDIAALKVLKHAIHECYEDTENQIKMIEEVFESINQDPSKISILGIKAMTLEAYMSAIKAGKTPLERDVFIVFYLQVIEGIEVTYFRILKNLAKAIGYSNTLLDQPFDMAVDNKNLFEMLHKEYIS